MANSRKTLAAISTCIQSFTFDRGAGSIDLQVDLDAFTDSYFQEIGRRQKERVREQEFRIHVNGNGNGTGADNAEPIKVEAEVKSDSSEILLEAPPQELSNVDSVESSETPSSAQAQVEDRLAEMIESIERIWTQAAKNVTNQKALRIDMLLAGDEPHQGSVLRGWDVEMEDGSPMPLNSETLGKLSQRALEELWEFCADKVRTVKKTQTVAAT